MTHGSLGNYLKTHRRRAGLTQHEVGRIVGYERPWQVSRHERSETIPPLLAALAYQEIFRVPISLLFAGIHETVSMVVENNLAEFEKELRTMSTRPAADAIEPKLKWLLERHHFT